jgi:hypothetical protein
MGKDGRCIHGEALQFGSFFITGSSPQKKGLDELLVPQSGQKAVRI